MSAPAWFDKDVYLVNKLAQLQADEPNNGWDMLKMLEAFNNAGFNPFTDDGIYAHFVAFGNAEGISPNAYFDEGTYFTNKLAQLQATEPDKGWTSVDQVKEAFADAGLSAWDHYTLFGTAEGVSPSKYFDTNAYMKAKLTQMQADDPAYTMTQLQQAFKDADLNPIEHYILFGKDENLSYTPYPIPVDDDKPVVELQTGTTFTVDGETSTTLPDEYSLVGSAANLKDAAYNIVAGANGDITVKDSVANLIGDDGKVVSTATSALALASKVQLADTLSNLVQANLPSEIAAKSVSYLVNSVGGGITLKNVTVAKATDIDSVLTAFLSNPYVTYADGITAPTSADDVTVTISSVTDTAANLAAADLSKIGDTSTTFTVKDTAANVEGMSVTLANQLDGVHVRDTLANIVDMSTISFGTANSSFSATDTTSANITIDGDFNTTFTGKTIDLSDMQKDQTITVTLKGADADTGVTFKGDVFSLGKGISGVTFDITGTAAVDTITANENGGIINGNGGADQISLGSGADTIALDAWKNTADAVVVTGFEHGKDTFDLNGNSILGSFDFNSAVTTIATNGTIGSNTYDGGVFFITGSDAGFSESDSVTALFQSADAGSSFDKGESFLIIANANTQGTFVWYVKSDGDGTIGTEEVHLVAQLKEGAYLDAADFGVTSA